MSEVITFDQTIILNNDIMTKLKNMSSPGDTDCSAVIAKALNCPHAQIFKPEGYLNETIRNIRGKQFQEAFKQDKVTYWSFIGFTILCPYSLLAPYMSNILYVFVFFLGLFLGYRLDNLYGRLFVQKKAERMPLEQTLQHKLRMYEPVTELVKVQNNDNPNDTMRQVVISGYLSEGLKRISLQTGKSPDDVVTETLSNYISKYQAGSCGIGANIFWFGVWVLLMITSSVMLSIFITMIRS